MRKQLLIGLVCLLVMPVWAQLKAPQVTEVTSWKDSAVVYWLAFSADGKILASANGDCSIVLWESATGKKIDSWRVMDNHVMAAVFAPDSKNIACIGDRLNFFKIWNIETADESLMLPHPQVSCLAFSTDGKMLASGGNGVVKIWDLVSATEIKSLEQEKEVSCLAFSPDGKTVAVAGNNSPDVILWDVAKGQKVTVFTCQDPSSGNTPEPASLAFSSDGKYLAVGGGYCLLNLWDVAGKKLVKAYVGHTYRINRVAFAAGGKLLASAGNDKVMRVWGIPSGVKRDINHEGEVYAVAFSPDGNMLVSADYQCNIRLWKLGK